MYWGYSVRVVNKFEDIEDECPLDSGSYDLKIGVSDKGEVADYLDLGQKHSGFKHALVFFGGLEGIDGIIEQDERTKLTTQAIKDSFNYLVRPLGE